MFYLKRVVFATIMPQKLVFSEDVEKKNFAGVNRHQGTLKVQGPWSFLLLFVTQPYEHDINVTLNGTDDS